VPLALLALLHPDMFRHNTPCVQQRVLLKGKLTPRVLQLFESTDHTSVSYRIKVRADMHIPVGRLNGRRHPRWVFAGAEYSGRPNPDSRDQESLVRSTKRLVLNLLRIRRDLTKVNAISLEPGDSPS
jgi:hypothetical protein